MFLVRVILLSHIVSTVYTSFCGSKFCSYKCCGESKDQCQFDCTGIVCTHDSHCGDQCCIGKIRFYYKGHCGACHKTRNCRKAYLGDFCREKCCGSDDNHLQCLKTCAEISCKSDSHCDGECCNGEEGSKTCAPCTGRKPAPLCETNFDCHGTRCCKYGSCSPKRHVGSCLSTDKPPTTIPRTVRKKCIRNLDCATKCCKVGACWPKFLCPSTTKPSSPPTISTARSSSPPTTREPQCSRSLDCATNCCLFRTCVHSKYCPSTDRPSSPPPRITAVWTTDGHCRQDRDCSTSNCCRYGTCWSREHCPYTTDRPSTTSLATTKRCIRNLDCATGCCVRGQCFSQQKCQSTVSPQAESSSVDLKKAIIIPIAGIVFLVILGVSIYCFLNRRRKRASLGTSQTTSHVLLTNWSD